MEQNYSTSEIMLAHHHAFCRKYGYTVEHFVLERKKEYNPSGRFQTEQEAKLFDAEIRLLLKSKQIKYTDIVGDNMAAEKIVNLILKKEVT
jgi:hypothetical protein